MFNGNFITGRDIVAMAVVQLAGRDCVVGTHKRHNVFTLDSAVQYSEPYDVWCAVDIDAAKHAPKVRKLFTDEVLAMRECISENFILRDYRPTRRIRSKEQFDQEVKKCVERIRETCTDALFEMRLHEPIITVA